MSSAVITLLILVLLVFAIILLYILRINKKLKWLEEQSLNHALAIDNQQLNDVQQHQLLSAIDEKFQAPILESEQVTKQLTVRTKNIQAKIIELEQNI